MAVDDNDSEKKKMSAKDIAFIVFLVLFMICVLALIAMTVGMSRGWWDKKLLGKVGGKLGMIADEPRAVVKSSVTIATSGVTVVFACVLAIIYFTKKEKTT